MNFNLDTTRKFKFLTVNDVDFIVQEEKGIVVAKIKSPIDVFYSITGGLYEITEDHSIINSFYVETDCWQSEEFNRLKKIRGIAKCMSEDTFNIETGKKIALLKLQKKYFDLVIDFIRPYVIEIEHLNLIFTEHYYSLNKLVMNLQKEIDSFNI